LDTKQNLMKSQASRSVLIKVRPDVLPAALQPLLKSQMDGGYELRLETDNALEMILAALREAGILVKEIEILKPDLEQIFVSVMRRHAEAAQAEAA
jgi:ABC-2 type transport system ATP-binding protein